LLADFGCQDDSLARVAQAVAVDRSLTYHETVDFRKLPLTYVPALAALLDLGWPSSTRVLRFLHLGASHGVFCRFLQDLPGVALAVALDLSASALRHGRQWGLRAGVVADAVALAACRSGWADAVLAESLYVPGYWRPADIARSLAEAGRVLRAGGVLLIQEWGFDPARDFVPALADAGLAEVHRVMASAPTQQGERQVTCCVFGRRTPSPPTGPEVLP
jgi:SAM-dependent methyltransferase